MVTQDELANEAPPKPVQWTWIVQRAETDGKAASIWKFGFIAPDGAEVRVTFHQMGEDDTKPPEPAPTDPMTGMPVQNVVPPGQPDTDKTENAVFYVTFFSNRNPEHFMKWDVSLSHEDSLTTWVTITHGIIDFIRKAKPQNVILDDLANGKLKMVLRSVSMDIAAANEDYELEFVKRHEYRGLYQIKKKGSKSAFEQAAEDGVQGENMPPEPTQGDPEKPVEPSEPPTDTQSAPEEPKAPQTPPPIKNVPVKKGLTVEIGKDYSVTVRDSAGMPVDKFRGQNPADILRWIKKKGYGTSRMKVVDKEQPETNTPAPAPQPAQEAVVEPPSRFMIDGSKVKAPVVNAKQAAIINYFVNASQVRMSESAVEFVFETDRDMNFKKVLVELGYRTVVPSEV